MRVYLRVRPFFREELCHNEDQVKFSAEYQRFSTDYSSCHDGDGELGLQP